MTDDITVRRLYLVIVLRPLFGRKHWHTTMRADAEIDWAGSIPDAQEWAVSQAEIEANERGGLPVWVGSCTEVWEVEDV